GSSSFTSANANSSRHQNSVFRTSSVTATAARAIGGRKASMERAAYAKHRSYQPAPPDAVHSMRHAPEPRRPRHRWRTAHRRADRGTPARARRRRRDPLPALVDGGGGARRPPERATPRFGPRLRRRSLHGGGVHAPGRGGGRLARPA